MKLNKSNCDKTHIATNLKNAIETKLKNLIGIKTTNEM